MTKTKFTQGPWDVISDPLHFDSMTTVVGKGYDPAKHPVMRMIVQVGGHAEVAELEADARLIAAAPSLYAELERLDPTNPVLATARGEG